MVTIVNIFSSLIIQAIFKLVELAQSDVIMSVFGVV